MQLINLLEVEDSLGYFEDSFRRMIEDHLTLIRQKGVSQTITLTPILGVRFQGDYFGLLTSLKIPNFMQWITMRVNGLLSPFELKADMTSITIVDTDYIRRLYNTHRTQTGAKRG